VGGEEEEERRKRDEEEEERRRLKALNEEAERVREKRRWAEVQAAREQEEVSYYSKSLGCNPRLLLLLLLLHDSYDRNGPDKRQKIKHLWHQLSWDWQGLRSHYQSYKTRVALPR